MIGKRRARWTLVAGLALGLAACGEPKGKAPVPGLVPSESKAVLAPAAPPTSPGPVVADKTAPAPLPGAPLDANQLRTRLITAFSGFEHVPDRAELLALAPAEQLTPALWALWQDATVRQIIRTNALVSLRFFPSPQVQAWFEQLLADPATAPTVRRPLAKAYGYAFGAAAIPVLGQQLDHPEPHTRDSAARALGTVSDPRARALLEKRLTVETEPFVRQTLQKLLANPAGAP